MQLPHRCQPVTGVHRGRALRRSTSTPASTIEADGVVLATDVAGLQHIVGTPPISATGVAHARRRSGHRAAVPGAPAVARPPVNPDRPAFLGTGGLPPLDNVSVLERYEARGRRMGARTGGSVVELHAYAVGRNAHDELRGRLLARLHELYPETASAHRRRRTGAVPQRLPAVRAGRLRPPPGRGNAAPRPGPGRRRHSHRPSRGAHGARRHHGLHRRQPAALALRHRGPHAAHRPDPGPLGGAAAARRREGQSAAHEHVARVAGEDRKSIAAPVPSSDPLGRPRPTYRDADARRHRSALARSQRRPSGNWYVFAASTAFGAEAARRHGRRRRDSSRGATPAVCTSAPRAARTWVPTSAPAPSTAAHSSARGTACDSTAAVNSAGRRFPPRRWRAGVGSAGHGRWRSRRLEAPVVPDRPAGAQISPSTRLESAPASPTTSSPTGSTPGTAVVSPLLVHPARRAQRAARKRRAVRRRGPVPRRRDLPDGQVGVPVIAEFISPGPRTIVMRIIEGEGAGSVVETHATPIGPGRRAAAHRRASRPSSPIRIARASPVLAAPR